MKPHPPVLILTLIFTFALFFFTACGTPSNGDPAAGTDTASTDTASTTDGGTSGGGDAGAAEVVADSWQARLDAFVPTQKYESALGGGWIAAGQPGVVRLKEVLDMGATIITLRYKSEDPYDEEAMVKQEGGTLVRYPVKSANYENADFRNKLWDIYDFWQGKGGLVFLHCKSSNRVGASWALYQYDRKGASAQEAWELGKKAGMTSASDVVKKVLGL